MKSGSRKFTVWFISLMVLLVIYVFYSRLSRTPHIEIDTGLDFNESVAAGGDINQSPNPTVGKIGGVGVGAVQKARYEHLNDSKQVDREFGFEKLLHETGDEWELEKPFMNVFRPGFKCFITAEQGKVRVENVVGRPSPQDATLFGNVVIHILPEDDNGIGESFVYLDDVTFLSERSTFSTAGPVRFASPKADMLGKGLELIYNDRLNRLELLRIAKLYRLTLKVLSKPSSISSRKEVSSAEKSANAGGQIEAESPQAKTSPLPNTQPPTQENKQRYRCIFRKNVVIDCPKELVFADKVSSADMESGKRPKNEFSDRISDILVTCDGGILVTPMDSPNISADRDELELKETDSVVAKGSSELEYYINKVSGSEVNETAFPARITAREKVEVLPSENQIIFSGGCVGKMLRNYSDIQQKYVLSSPDIFVNLAGGKSNSQFFGFSSGLKSLAATGGNVKLAVVKTAGKKLLGGVELKCRRCDYDAAGQLFMAAGPPSVIKVDNAGIAESHADTAKFSLQRRCYAFVRDFETLKYNLKANQIIADANSQGILIDYFPIVQGQQGQQMAVTAAHLELNLAETAGGKTELSVLNATGGVTYEDQDKQFAGSRLLYNAGKSMITAYGDQVQPCLLNGALVDAIEYDLNNEIIRTSITGAGAVHVGR